MDAATKLLEHDSPKWIFPLHSPVLFAKTDPTAIRNHLNGKLFDSKQPDGFVACQTAYSRKDEHHLRRVLVLDPFATFFLYDFLVAQHAAFSRTTTVVAERHVYGHTFDKGKPVDAFAQYHAFRRKKYELIAKHGHFAQLDIFNCFNSFYHHKVASFVAQQTTVADGNKFGQFLREINAGVSVACFPQGLYPAKVVGNAYLSLIEESTKLRPASMARFLDDIVLACGTRYQVDEQVLELQYILDKHHLALNESKTVIGAKGQRFQERKLDKIKKVLLKKREEARAAYDDVEAGEVQLDDQERAYLTALIQKPNVAQEDVELALTLLASEPDALDLVIDPVLDEAPHLLRTFYRFLAMDDFSETTIMSAITSRVESEYSIPEHDLFWYARILIDRLTFSRGVADLLLRLFENQNATPVVKAAILESEHLSHGLADLKESVLRSDGTTLLVAAGMAGLCKLERGKRNHIYKYAARQGAHAAVLMDIAGKMPG
jgi:hypothetical protein